jgi:prepilin-type N-terminal cleavage/methylation domain-containing protein
MRNREGFTLIELMIVVVIMGLLASISIPNFIKMQDRAKEAKVKGAAHTLQLAAEDYAVRNGGIYSVAGGDLLPLLPVNKAGNRRLENPFTRNYSEPQFSAPAGTPGQVGIVAQIDVTGTASGYIINGFGSQGEIFVISNGQ